MSASTTLSSRTAFFGLTADETDDRIVALSLERFRGKQLRAWVYDRLITDPQLMTTFSAAQRATLANSLEFTAAQVAHRSISADGTMKLLLEWADGQVAETVMIPDGKRRTACISSQVGCPVGCRFCASGIGGVKGNLSAARIVEQVFQLNLAMSDSSPSTPAESPPLSPAKGLGAGDHQSEIENRKSKITNIVFMGMGEPLANYTNALQAVRVLHDPGCMNLGARRITISTVGVPQRIIELADESLPVNLAISLHAPTETLRKELIPWAHHFALDEILDAARGYFRKTGREITLEYILLAGVNDQPVHARQLAKLCKTLRANVNLIRYNEVPGLEFRRPKTDDVMEFERLLREEGVNAHLRKSRGRDIDAACGQLRRRHEMSGEVQD